MMRTMWHLMIARPPSSLRRLEIRFALQSIAICTVLTFLKECSFLEFENCAAAWLLLFQSNGNTKAWRSSVLQIKRDTSPRVLC
eukprot:2325445-Pleurochrysis_carterae.AAC.2